MAAQLSPVRAPTAVRILLVGTAGSGTSAVGRVLADRLGARALGSDAARLRELVERAATEPELVEVPPSAVLEPELRKLLRQAGRVVWLRASTQTRDPLYEGIADVTVDVGDLLAWQVAQEVLDQLGLGVFGWLPGGFEGVVLDLDGLLVDTEVIWEESKRRLYAARGLPFSIDDHRAVLGTSEDYTVKVFAQRFGVAETEHDRIRDEYLGHATALFAEGVPTRPGARELIASVHGRVPLGLASNTRRELVEEVLERANLGPFDAIVTGDEAPPKPEPGLYLEACRRLGITPSRSCAVEDSPTGVRGAKAAGLTCIGVPSDPGNIPDAADRLVASLLDLIEPSPS